MKKKKENIVGHLLVLFSSFFFISNFLRDWKVFCDIIWKVDVISLSDIFFLLFNFSLCGSQETLRDP